MTTLLPVFLVRLSGRDALADDAALDDDGALRALFAGDHARRNAGARGEAAGLLHFGQNRLEIHAHQRRRDLGLLLVIVGDAGGSALPWADRAALLTHFAVPASRDFVRALQSLAAAATTIEIYDATKVDKL